MRPPATASGRRVLAFTALVTGAAVLAAACSSNGSTGPRNATDLTGVYALVSFVLGGTTVPGASGGATFTQSTYKFQVNVPPNAFADSGGYRTVGDSLYETGNLCPQALGTFLVKTDTLEFSLSACGQTIAAVWHKTA